MLKSITLRGHSFTYREEGAGPALVLLPGWNEDHRMYKFMVESLAMNYRVLALAWRGHGERRAFDKDFNVDDMAEDVCAFVDALQIPQASFVSFSHGGWISLAAGEKLGIGRVPRFVLISWRVTAPGDVLLRWCREWQDADKWEAARTGFFDYALGTSTDPNIKHHINDEMKSFGASYWARTGREIAAGYATWGTPLDRIGGLREQRPVAHIYTLPHDSAYDQVQQDFARSHPWYKPYRLPGETHFPLIESPAAVSRFIHEFVSQN